MSQNEVIELDGPAAPSLVTSLALTRANGDYAEHGFLYNSALVYHGNKATALNKHERESVGKWTRRIQRFAKKKSAYAACKLGIVHGQLPPDEAVQRFAVVQVEHKDEGRAYLCATAGDKALPLSWVADDGFRETSSAAGHWQERLLPAAPKTAPVPGESLLGKVLEDIPPGGRLMHIAAYYHNDHDDGLGVSLGREDEFPQPLPLFGGTDEEAVALIDEICQRKGSLTDAAMFDFAMLVLTLELRGSIEPSEYHGCTLTFITENGGILASGSPPDPTVIGGQFVPAGHGPNTVVVEHRPEEQP